MQSNVTDSTKIDPRVYVTLDSLHKLKHSARGFSFLPKQPIHSILSGQKTSKIRGRGLDFNEIRTYLPGDDIRNIDWKVTARMRGKAYIRTYNEERDRQVLFIVDQRQSMFFGSTHYMKSVIAAEATAIGLWRTLSVKDRAGGIIFNDDEISVIRPNQSSKKASIFLNEITGYNQALHADRKTSSHINSLNNTLEKACQLIRHDGLIVLLSDLYGADHLTKKHLSRLSQRNDVIIGYIRDPMEHDLSIDTDFIIGDGELQFSLSSSEAPLIEKFSKSMRLRDEEIVHTLRKIKIPLLSLNTQEPAEAQIKKALGRNISGVAR